MTSLASWNEHVAWDLLECLPHPILVFDETAALIAANAAACRLLQVRRLPGRPSADALAELSQRLAGWPGFTANLVASSFQLPGVGMGAHHRLPDGEREFCMTVFRLAADEASVFAVELAETADRRLEERQHEMSRRYTEAILDSLPLGIVVMDTALRTTYVNRTQREWFGTQARCDSLLGLIGQPADELLADETGLDWPQVGDGLRRRQDVFADAEHRAEVHGREYLFSLTLAALKDAVGMVTGAIRIGVDITEKARLRRELKEAELVQARLETFRHMTTTVKHEINNALTAIFGALELLGPSLAADPESLPASMLRLVDTQAQRIYGFTRQLENVTTLETTPYLEGTDAKLVVLPPTTPQPGAACAAASTPCLDHRSVAPRPAPGAIPEPVAERTVPTPTPA